MRNMLQFVARLLCVAAFLCLGSGGVWAQAVGWDVWNGTDKTQPAGWQVGNATLTISSAAELAWLAETVNAGTTTGSASEKGFKGCTITLDTDIDLNDNEWTPIGGFTNPFKGSFDGKNHTIKNLKIENKDNSIDYAGIFGGAGNGTIQNLGVMISKQGITGKSSAGGIVGVIPELNLTIKNCFVTGGPIIVGNQAHFAGGILGYCYGMCNCTIEYCYAAVEKIISTYRGGGNSIGAGGIAGNATTINNCISLTNFIHSYLGPGTAGTVAVNRINTSSTIQNCYAIPTTILNNGKTITIPSGKDANSNDGADLTKDNFNRSNALDGWEKAGWTLHDGQLPTLDPDAEGLPIDLFFISGSGTSVDPYMIRNNNDLRYFAIQINNSSTDYNTKSFKLNDNITFSDVWTPLGTTDHPFKGTFDGNNKTITLGIKADANQAQAGLFGTIDAGAKVEKLAVCVTSDGITSTATGAASNAGAIAAINNGTINQCYVTGEGSILSANGTESYAGGIAGSNSGTISNCYNLIPVKVDEGATAHAGGIVGHNTGTVEKCFASGDVSTAEKTHATAEAAGGIVGFNDGAGSGKITNCVAVNSKVLVNKGSNSHRVIGNGGDENDVNNFSHHEMSLVTKAADTYDPLEGTALTKDNANSATGGCFNGWEAAGWNLDAIGTSLPKLKGFDGQKDISIASYLLYTVTINSVSYGILTVTRPAPLNTGGSSITVNNGDQVPYNTELSITAIPEDTYEIDKLTVGGAEFTSSKTYQVKDNVTVNATFKKIEYTVNINITGEGDLSITYPNPSTSSTGTPIKVKDGSKVPINTELTITATPASGYELKTLAVNGSSFTNGNIHTVTDNVTVSATFEADPVDPDPIEPDPIEPDPTPTPPQPTVYYIVTLPSVEGAATDPVAGEHEVESWSNFRFSLTLDSAYNQSVPVVTTDRGETLTPRQSDGAYILNQVRSNVEIYISGIVKNPDPVANEAIKATAAKVWITNNHLHLQSPVDADAYIYTAAGNQHITCKLKAGEVKTIQLPNGIYFVRIGEERFKVRL